MQLFTIGYATKPMETFLEQLARYKINAVADVRSVPYSKIFKEYHKESIAAHLQQRGLRYVYLGDELGPRSKDPQHYNSSGQVQFDRLMTAPLFKQGIARLESGLEKGFAIAMMCAEKDAATCHRSLLIGYYLAHHYQQHSQGTVVNISHINHDGEIESQAQLEARITAMHGQGDDLFMDQEECCQHAYQRQLELTSYRKPE